MKAAVFKGIESINLEDVPAPRRVPEDVVVEVSACGICGSDLHTYLHGSFVQPGQIMGHEFSGRIVEAGSEVQGLAVGDRGHRRADRPLRRVPRCREGRYNLCGVAGRRASPTASPAPSPSGSGSRARSWARTSSSSTTT